MLKKNIGLLVGIISVVIVIVGFMVMYRDKKNELEKIKDIQNKFDIIIAGDHLSANFEFVDNYNNKKISDNYLNIPNEELIEKGYIEYIQSSDYMIKFYNKIQIKQISIKEETGEEITCLIKVNRPNLFEIMDECDKDNINNENYNFNESFIEKIENNDFKYYEATYEIILKKQNDIFKFKYDDNFKELLYG